MALNVATLAQQLLDAEISAAGGPISPEGLAKLRVKTTQQAQAMLAFNVSATVTVTTTVAPGIPVTTAGSPAAQQGATVGPGSGQGTGVVS